MTPGISDAIALKWVRDTLSGSSLFVWVGLSRNTPPKAWDDFPAAWVYPVDFSEVDDVDPYQLTRILKYGVGLEIRVDEIGEDDSTLESLDALSNQVANLLSVNLPVGAIQGLSRIESGRYDTSPFGSSQPSSGSLTQGITLYGTIAYLIDGRDQRDPSD